MFGYVKPDRMELKLKEIYRYGNLYCGLCHALRKDYGQIYGCALSYDLTFLLLVLDGIADDTCEREFRCPLNPVKKKKVSVSESALRYTAFINYYLVYLKVNDDVIDDKVLWKKILRKVLGNNKKYLEQYKKYNNIAEKLKNTMEMLYEMENKASDFDDITNLFGEFFAEIFMGFFEEVHRYEVSEALYELCFNLGKWIYLVDAYDDYKKDTQKGNFNLISTMCFLDENPSEEQIHQRVQGLISLLVYNMNSNMEKFTFKRGQEIIDNITRYGCVQQYNKVLKRRYPEYLEKITKKT